MRYFVLLWLVLLSCSALLVGAETGQELRAGDLVQVRVHDNADLDMDVRVPVEGAVAYHFIGDVIFTGRSPEAVARDIRVRLEDGYLLRADVAVNVAERAQRSVYVLGAVRVPGSVHITGDPLSALQAIAASGGFIETADRAGTRVMRDNPDEPGAKTSIQVPSGDDPASLASDPRLLPGDTIVVPRRDRIYVLGQVLRPGALDVPTQGKLTAGQAIAQAGGFDRFARQSSVLLLRTGEPPQTVNLKKILAGESVDIDLQPGDSLVVPESRF